MIAERETRQSLVEVIRRLKTAIGPAVAALAGVQPGRLVSLSVPLPEGLMLPDAAPRRRQPLASP